MIKELDQKTKDRVNKAISNIRLIATRVKRANVLDAVQRAETVVNLLNEFRQYINLANTQPDLIGRVGAFEHDRMSLARVYEAIAQADNIHNMLTKVKKKSFTQEYTQAWRVLEDIQIYLQGKIDEEATNAQK